MKTLKKITLVLSIPLIYFVVFSGIKESEGSFFNLNKARVVTPPPAAPKDFTNYIWNIDNVWTLPDNWVLNNLTKYKQSLYFTGIQIYDHLDGTDMGSDWYGTFQQDLTETQKDHIEYLNDEVMTGEGLKFLYERVKISKLCYAQRLVYEAEGNGNVDYNDGFSYQYMDAEVVPDQGKTVVRATLQYDPTPRYICKDIYENLQHGDMLTSNIQEDAGVWHLKPMMRIPVGTPPEKEVIKIEVINFRGDDTPPFKTITIKAENFGLNYDGSYKEIFTDVDMEVSGSTTDGLNAGIHTYWPDWKTDCKVDFRIWWCGEVDVWFDKMTVDDKYGDGLFTGNYDYHILDETTPEIFYLTALMVKDRRFKESNYEAVNYVMNVMYSHLRNSATLDISSALNYK